MDINKLIQNIDLLSAQKGVNKTNALAECGAGKNFISNIMKGSDPSIAKVEQVADYYGVSIDYLLGRTTAHAVPDDKGAAAYSRIQGAPRIAACSRQTARHRRGNCICCCAF